MGALLLFGVAFVVILIVLANVFGFWIGFIIACAGAVLFPIVMVVLVERDKRKEKTSHHVGRENNSDRDTSSDDTGNHTSRFAWTDVAQSSDTSSEADSGSRDYSDQAPGGPGYGW